MYSLNVFLHPTNINHSIQTPVNSWLLVWLILLCVIELKSIRNLLLNYFFILERKLPTKKENAFFSQTEFPSFILYSSHFIQYTKINVLPALIRSSPLYIPIHFHITILNLSEEPSN